MEETVVRVGCYAGFSIAIGPVGGVIDTLRGADADVRLPHKLSWKILPNKLKKLRRNKK
jgi:hypothetical protein